MSTNRATRYSRSLAVSSNSESQISMRITHKDTRTADEFMPHNQITTYYTKHFPFSVLQVSSPYWAHLSLVDHLKTKFKNFYYILINNERITSTRRSVQK